MDKLTAIKIKYDDGTYSDEIPVSVLSENVEWDSTHTLVDVLGSIDVDVTGTIQDQISQLFNEKVSTSTLQSYVANQLNTDVTNWLNTNVNPVGSAVVVDKTLTIAGAAADAKIVGEEMSNLNTFFSTKRLSSSNTYGYFTSTTLQYWNQSANVIAYIPCEPNKKYQITKDIETSVFSLAYIKETPQTGVQQPVYNYIALNGTLDNKINYLTGEGAQYLLVLLGQVNISLASHVYFYTFEIEQLNELDERITEIEEQNLNSRLNTVEQNLSDYVTNDIYESLSWTTGYMGKDGITYAVDTLQYSNKISVQSGDVVSFESTSSANSFRFITAFTNNTAIYNLGVENVKTYTIPENINYIVVTTYKEATDAKIFYTHKSLINVSELKNDVNELKEDNIEIQENINLLNTDINTLKKDVQEVLSGTYGFFNDTQLIYWRQSGNYIVYFKCKPNYRYRIQKNISSNLFKICYIKQEPAPSFVQSIFNLKVYSGSSTDIDIYYETGDDALYLLMLIGVQTEAEDIIIQNNIRVSSKQVMIIDEEARHIVTYDQAYLPRNLYLLIVTYLV